MLFDGVFSSFLFANVWFGSWLLAACLCLGADSVLGLLRYKDLGSRLKVWVLFGRVINGFWLNHSQSCVQRFSLLLHRVYGFQSCLAASLSASLFDRTVKWKDVDPCFDFHSYCIHSVKCNEMKQVRQMQCIMFAHRLIAKEKKKSWMHMAYKHCKASTFLGAYWKCIFL